MLCRLAGELLNQFASLILLFVHSLQLARAHSLSLSSFLFSSLAHSPHLSLFFCLSFWHRVRRSSSVPLGPQGQRVINALQKKKKKNKLFSDIESVMFCFRIIGIPSTEDGKAGECSLSIGQFETFF